jgi:hypothetical protein
MSKVTDDLRVSLEESRDGDTLAECLVSIDDNGAAEVHSLIVNLGGNVRHHVSVVPGLVAILPMRAIGPVASNEHVVLVEGDGTYTAL